MRLRSAFLLFCNIATILSIGEVLNLKTVVAPARNGCGVKPNPNCPSTIAAPWGRKLDALHIPPDWTCPCPANGQSGGVFAGASGTPIVPNPDAGKFLDVPLAAGFQAPVAMSFSDNTNELFVGERQGRIWRIDLTTGAKQVIYDNNKEVGYSGDRGLMDIRTSPNYAVTRMIAMHFTVAPDPNAPEEPNLETAANQRVITLKDPGQGPINPASRVVLIGPGEGDGVPVCFNTHALGGLRFGSDGSLLLTAGEGGHWNFDMGDWGQDAQAAFYSNAPSLDYQCVQRFGAQQDIGSWRSQVLYSLGGKILRISPQNGEGICPGSMYANQFDVMNPYCDNSNGKSVQSKVWGRGFRQPLRMTMRPFNAATDNAPGVFYVGDVGQGGYEEVNVVNKAGQNFGWPCWEGPMPMPSSRDSQYNDNPNYVYNTGCGSPTSACGPITSTAIDEDGIRLTCAHIYHNKTTTIPFMFWTRFGDKENTNQYNMGETYFTGNGFNGATTAGLAFYTGTKYPARYRNQVFALDYSNLWVNVLYGDNDQFTHSENFAGLWNTPGPKVTLEAGGPDGNICYLTLDGGEVRCFVYQVANAAPTPVPSAVENSGIAPATIHFNADGTLDRENDVISFLWDFGDGTTSNKANPKHTYETAGVWNATLRTTDKNGNSGIANLTVYSNNKRPKVTITSPKPNLPGNAYVYTAGQPVLFEATADDDGTIVDWEWEYQFMHNYHYHPKIKVVNGKSSFLEPQPPDEGALERNTLRIYARATDDQGLVGEAWILVIRPDWETSFTPNKAPIPSFNISGHQQVGQPFVFDATATVDPNQDYILYSWDFGDGLKGEGVYTTHTYDAYKADGYTVTLYTQDNFGASGTTTFVVNPSPDPSFTNETYVCDGEACFTGSTMNTEPSADTTADSQASGQSTPFTVLSSADVTDDTKITAEDSTTDDNNNISSASTLLLQAIFAVSLLLVL